MVEKEVGAIELTEGVEEDGVAVVAVPAGTDDGTKEVESGFEDEGAAGDEPPVPGVGLSPTLTQPDFSVISEGQETVSHSTL